MFLSKLMQDNPKLVEVAIQLHQEQTILPDTYILDLDMISMNAQKMVSVAQASDIELFFMTKQLGRNPIVAKKLCEAGMHHAVTVDYREALQMIEHQIPIGNVGHLVQIPTALLEKIILNHPLYITVYSQEILASIDHIAKKHQLQQPVLIKVIGADDLIYDGQQGGILLDDLPAYLAYAKQFEHIKVAGVTSFPCLLYEESSSTIKQTPNATTLINAKKVLEEAGISHPILNMPSATCCHTIPLIKEFGGFQGEPGHALTGTTPLHLYRDQPEKIAMAYVSEISHYVDDKSYCYGGGYYRRGKIDQALIVSNEDRRVAKVRAPHSENIDYHLEVQDRHAIGSSVVMAFRTQIFVTRSEVAVVSGIQSGEARLEGIYDSQGKYLRGRE
ncbi:alanine racemase (plasmid) [Entomospira entomophila]|uniref:YhfX family PLP-dependent enzyme n=1 Tax=Entomospira entomophila TaxID=2719988 RepID=A0A968KTD2_9SPIO|nr:alanine racemase [Entomospira entomophilus]NIZ41312.1 YhfX family PLP-dependent enzyme [Entomospira entomophilus]WDI36165.1 alanine racemase [Entomospira entomophilus]